MPSSKCGGFIPSKRNRKTVARPMMSQGVHSLSASAFFQVSNCGARSGKSASAPASALLALAVRILVTGGCDFIGSNFIRYMSQHYKPTSVTNVDALTYAGNLDNVAGVVEEHGERYEFSTPDYAIAES